MGMKDFIAKSVKALPNGIKACDKLHGRHFIFLLFLLGAASLQLGAGSKDRSAARFPLQQGRSSSAWFLRRQRCRAIWE